MTDLILMILLFLIFPSAAVFGVYMAKKQIKLEAEWREFQLKRKELYQHLADPSQIEKDFENGARWREMHDANRTTLPREDAEPPAVVHRPLLRGAKPGSWRPRNPGSPSKE